MNLAVSDSTSPMHLETIRESLAKQDANVFGLVVITSGGNDLMHSRGRFPPREAAMYGATLAQAQPWIENYEVRLDAMIDLLREPLSRRLYDLLGRHLRSQRRRGRSAAAGLPAWPDCMTDPSGLQQSDPPRGRPARVGPRRADARGVSGPRHPLHPALAQHYRLGDPTYWYAVNLENPNVRGYDAIRRLFLIEIAKCADAIAAKR